mmetsp:Transcript_11966/g.28691  ORF Transcript_11966/g.28691 Transcript_11966/m.28691 type:complete len:271 (+) Transcript_11966:513-1325(+)
MQAMGRGRPRAPCRRQRARPTSSSRRRRLLLLLRRPWRMRKRAALRMACMCISLRMKGLRELTSHHGSTTTRAPRRSLPQQLPQQRRASKPGRLKMCRRRRTQQELHRWPPRVRRTSPRRSGGASMKTMTRTFCRPTLAPCGARPPQTSPRPPSPRPSHATVTPSQHAPRRSPSRLSSRMGRPTRASRQACSACSTTTNRTAPTPMPPAAPHPTTTPHQTTHRPHPHRQSRPSASRPHSRPVPGRPMAPGGPAGRHLCATPRTARRPTAA